MSNGNPPNQNLNLPPPVVLPEAIQNTPKAETAGATEVQSTAPVEVASAPPIALPSLPVMPATSINTPQAAATNTTTATPVVADDNDLIEKEWVVKAKQIIERTKDNPYSQNKELTVFKADYMKKRYNKAIKLSE